MICWVSKVVSSAVQKQRRIEERGEPATRGRRERLCAQLKNKKTSFVCIREIVYPCLSFQNYNLKLFIFYLEFMFVAGQSVAARERKEHFERGRALAQHAHFLH